MYFCAQMKRIKKVWGTLVFLSFSVGAGAQDTIGPEGNKLIWLLAAVILILIVLYLLLKPGSLSGLKNLIFFSKRIRIDLVKDRKYYPDFIEMKIKNTGGRDVDISQPLLIFDNFWFKRKFKIKGTNNYHFYPLILGKGDTHTLDIDLNRFYKHDYRLKKYPKVKLVIAEREGKKLGSRSVFLRKTLLKF